MDSQVAQEGRHVVGAQARRVALVVKDDEAFNPVAIRLLGPNAVVPDANGRTDLGEQGTGFVRLVDLVDDENARRVDVVAWWSKPASDRIGQEN